MWVQTRVGLARVSGPCEILAHSYPDLGTSCVYARLKASPEGAGTVPLAKLQIHGATVVLAMFTNGPDVGAAIAAAMRRLAASAAAGDPPCDLSQEGDAEAWGSAWLQIGW